MFGILVLQDTLVTHVFWYLGRSFRLLRCFFYPGCSAVAECWPSTPSRLNPFLAILKWILHFSCFDTFPLSFYLYLHLANTPKTCYSLVFLSFQWCTDMELSNSLIGYSLKSIYKYDPSLRKWRKIHWNCCVMSKISQVKHQTNENIVHVDWLNMYFLCKSRLFIK